MWHKHKKFVRTHHCSFCLQFQSNIIDNLQTWMISENTPTKVQQCCTSTKLKYNTVVFVFQVSEKASLIGRQSSKQKQAITGSGFSRIYSNITLFPSVRFKFTYWYWSSATQMFALYTPFIQSTDDVWPNRENRNKGSSCINKMENLHLKNFIQLCCYWTVLFISNSIVSSMSNLFPIFAP